MLRLLFIRHAESVGNAEGRMMGQRNDPLTPRGQRQAQHLGERLRHLSPNCIYASPLQRAMETVAILQQAQSSPVTLQYLDDLREFQNGVFAGLTWAEARGRYPNLCQQLTQAKAWIPVPGAETLQAGRDRGRRVVDRLLHHQSHEHIWVVSHHWILQHIVSVVLGCQRTWEFPLDHTGLIEIWLDRDRWSIAEHALNSSLWQIHRLNDTDHLAHLPDA